MTEQGYNYMEDAVTLQHMAEFFETRCENLEVKPTGKKPDKRPLRNAKLYSLLVLTRNPQRTKGLRKQTSSTVCTTDVAGIPQKNAQFSRI